MMKHFYDNTFICGSLDFLPDLPQEFQQEVIDVALNETEKTPPEAHLVDNLHKGIWFRKYKDLDGTEYNGRPNIRFELSEACNKWVKENITPHATMAYSNINYPSKNDNGTTIVHTDTNRDWVLMYIVTQSNTDQYTKFWQEENKPLIRDRACFPTSFDNYNCIVDACYEKGKWYLMRTNVLHSQHNILGKDRLARLAIHVNVDGDPLTPGFFKESVV